MSAQEQDEVKVWDVTTGQEIQTLRGHTRVAFSPDGRCLAYCMTWTHAFDPRTNPITPNTEGHPRNAVTTWCSDADRRRNLGLSNAGEVPRVSFSPDGQWFASTQGYGGSHAYVIVFGLASDVRSELSLVGLGGGAFPSVTTMAFSCDGKLLAAASADKTIRIWNLPAKLRNRQRISAGSENCRPLFTLKGHGSPVDTLLFSPDGERLLSASEDRLILWDTFTGQELLILKGQGNGVVAATFDKEAYRLAAVGRDGAVNMWDGRPLDEGFGMRELSNLQRAAEALELATLGLHGSQDRARGAYEYVIRQYPVHLLPPKLKLS
jgi:WD40 repeat protein